MLRKAGDIFAEFNENLKQQQINAYYRDPSKLVGAGTYGRVFESPTSGRVIKQNHPGGYSTVDSMITEADIQDAAATLRIAPRVHTVETFPEGTVRIEMDDTRRNYLPVQTGVGGLPTDPVVNIATAKQLGALALKGIRLDDRHGGNIRKHKMVPGNLKQIDMGVAGYMSDDQKAAHLANVTAEGFEAAGIGEMGSILRATVMDYLEGGQVAEAMDVAKQAFSRLQKIKEPLV